MGYSGQGLSSLNIVLGIGYINAIIEVVVRPIL